MGGQISSGTKPSFHKREANGWTGLQPFLALSGGLLVHKRGHVLPHRVTRQPPHPPTASLEMVTAFQQPVDVHVIVDFWRFRWPPVLLARVRHLWRVAWRRTARVAWALLGMFGVSAVIHDLRIWGLERGTEICTVGFFVLMGVGVILEHAF